MPTAQELAAKGLLEQVDPDDILDPGQLPERQIFLLPRAKAWLDTHLSGLENDGFNGGSKTPEEQLYILFNRFISGCEVLDPDLPPKQMQPVPSPVWELRTSDLRVFGWFCQHGTFIASAVNTKDRCVSHNLYAGYRTQCKNDIANLDLDPPKFLMGEGRDVL